MGVVMSHVVDGCTCDLRNDPWKAPEQHARGCPERERLNAPAIAVPRDLEKMPIEYLRKYVRAIRGWYIATLRGNNYNVDEDAMLHMLFEDDKADTGKDRPDEWQHARCEPCTFVADLLQAADDGRLDDFVKSVRAAVKHDD